MILCQGRKKQKVKKELETLRLHNNRLRARVDRVMTSLFDYLDVIKYLLVVDSIVYLFQNFIVKNKNLKISRCYAQHDIDFNASFIEKSIRLVV